MAKALLFDVGDVMMLSNWEVLDELEQVTGRSIPGRGPFAPADDADWQDFLRGDIDGYAYWDRKAIAAGYSDAINLFAAFPVHLPNIFAADAMELIEEARAAHIPIGILSNDLVRIAGPTWTANAPELQGYDVFVDATLLGVRKPAPEGYLKCIADFGLPAEEIVFLDDTPECVEGARANGMIGVHVDPLNRGIAFARARELVGLVPPSEASLHVQAVERAYADRDLDAAMALLHPHVVIRWNGEKVASGMAEARRFHRECLGFDAADMRHDYLLTKTLRAFQADTICVEGESSYRRSDGTHVRRTMAEFWMMRFGLIIEWNAYEAATEQA